MKIQLASDLHLEFLAKRFPGERLIGPHPEADVLVLAGDSASGTDPIVLFRDWPVPVIYVLGNHELYGHDFDDLLVRLRLAAEGTNIHFLERDTAKGEHLVADVPARMESGAYSRRHARHLFLTMTIP